MSPKAPSPVPAVFVWLSVQSVVVVATAIWFRSRFIVAASFLIYAAIVLGYILVAQRETGRCWPTTRTSKRTIYARFMPVRRV